MKKNVLLLCLSMTKVNSGRDGIYSYDCNGVEDDVEGYLTNEAPTKSIIKKLDALEDGERLDEVIVICSESVRMPVINDENRSRIDECYRKRKEKVLAEDRERFDDLTHIELYESLIHRFSFSEDVKKVDYKSEPIRFHRIPISDDTNGAEVAEAAVEAARYLETQDDMEIDLYIDYNGGQRYMAFMIVAIANLAKVRHVQVKEILTMNYEQKGKNKDSVPIQNMKDVFESVDLVAGVHEYINYGRTKMLNTYFDVPIASDGINKIKDILNDMREFSYALQLCNTDDVFKKKETLKRNLEEYKANAESLAENRNQDAVDTYEILFSYVVDDILTGYKILFEGNVSENLPEIIKWCIEKDYIQQALTFYTERMPVYFYNSGIYAPTEEEQKKYDNFHSYCRKKSKEKIDDKDPDYNMIEDYKKYYEKYDKIYSWIIKYLPQSHSYRRIYKNESGQLVSGTPEPHQKKRKKRKIPSAVENETLFVPQTRRNINGYANMRIRECDMGRACSNISKRQLKQVLVDYFSAKDLRNMFNHADGKRSENICYENVCEFVNGAMDRLIECMREGAGREKVQNE